MFTSVYLLLLLLVVAGRASGQSESVTEAGSVHIELWMNPSFPAGHLG